MTGEASDSLHTRWSRLDHLHSTESEAAWRWFIDRYRRYIRTVLSRTLHAWGRGGEIEAALGEIWGYLYSARVIDRADRGRRFRPFLSGTVRNFARDYCRQHRRPGQELGDGEPWAIVDPNEGEEIRLFAHQVLHLALDGLERRQPAQARAVRWYYGLGGEADPLGELVAPTSVADISKRLGLTPNAVHQALFRGRRALQARIEAELRETVATGSDHREELSDILAVLGSAAPGLTARIAGQG